MAYERPSALAQRIHKLRRTHSAGKLMRQHSQADVLRQRAKAESNKLWQEENERHGAPSGRVVRSKLHAWKEVCGDRLAVGDSHCEV